MFITSFVQKYKSLSLISLIIIFQVIGGLTGWITTQGIDGWYQTLNKSPLTPPDYLFGVVWSFLYLLLAYSFWMVLIKEGGKKKTFIIKLFCAHLILNWLWSPLFFLAHAVIVSFLLILVILMTATLLAKYLYNLNKAAFMPFIPYLGWLSFASYLSFYVLLYN